MACSKGARCALQLDCHFLAQLQTFDCPLALGITAMTFSLPYLPRLLSASPSDIWEERSPFRLVCHCYNHPFLPSPPHSQPWFRTSRCERVGADSIGFYLSPSFIWIFFLFPCSGVCALTPKHSQVNWQCLNPLKGEGIKQFSLRCGINCLVSAVSKGL